MEDAFLNIVAIILLIAPVIDWTATYILWRAARKAPKDAVAVRERLFVAFILALSTSLSGVLALARITATTLGILFVILLATSLILTTIPNLYWLWLYMKSRID